MRKKVKLTDAKFCHYWMLPECPDKDGKHKVIIIQEESDGYYTTDLNETKQTIMNMNEDLGLTKDEVADLGQLNCKTMFAYQPKGFMNKKYSTYEKRTHSKEWQEKHNQ